MQYQILVAPDNDPTAPPTWRTVPVDSPAVAQYIKEHGEVTWSRPIPWERVVSIFAPHVPVGYTLVKVRVEASVGRQAKRTGGTRVRNTQKKDST